MSVTATTMDPVLRMEPSGHIAGAGGNGARMVPGGHVATRPGLLEIDGESYSEKVGSTRCDGAAKSEDTASRPEPLGHGAGTAASQRTEPSRHVAIAVAASGNRGYAGQSADGSSLHPRENTAHKREAAAAFDPDAAARHLCAARRIAAVRERVLARRADSGAQSSFAAAVNIMPAAGGVSVLREDASSDAGGGDGTLREARHQRYLDGGGPMYKKRRLRGKGPPDRSAIEANAPRDTG